MEIGKVHLAGELYVPPDFVLKSKRYYQRKVRAIIKKHGLHPVGRSGGHVFDGGGITLFVMLEESHVSFHTWIELGYVDVDIFVCNVTQDNTSAAWAIEADLQKLFQATRSTIERLKR